MDSKQYITKGSKALAVVQPIAMIMMFFLILDPNCSQLKGKYFVMCPNSIIFYVWLGVSIFLLFRLGVAIRFKVNFENGVWTFFPVKFIDNKKGKYKRLSFSVEELIRFDLPKFSKNDEYTKLLITVRDKGEEVTAQFNSDFWRLKAQELLQDVQNNYPEKLSAEAEIYIDNWKDKRLID